MKGGSTSRAIGPAAAATSNTIIIGIRTKRIETIIVTGMTGEIGIELFRS
jgi:hypothetical protein